MPSATPITLTDAAGTPVATIFTPMRIGADKALFSAKTYAQTSAGAPLLSLSLNSAKRNRPTNHVDYDLALPFEHTVDGIVKVSHTARANGRFILPEEMSTVDRENFAAWAGALVTEAIMIAYVKDLEPIWS